MYYLTITYGRYSWCVVRILCMSYILAVSTYGRQGGGGDSYACCFEQVYAAMDTISSWLFGRFTNIRDFDNFFDDVFTYDIELTAASQGQQYAPNVWPDFSWANVHTYLNST